MATSCQMAGVALGAGVAVWVGSGVAGLVGGVLDGGTAVGVTGSSVGSASETAVVGGTAVSQQPVERKKQRIRKIAAAGWWRIGTLLLVDGSVIE